MRKNQRYFIRLAVLTTTLIMSPLSVGEIIFQEDFSGHRVNFSINSANGWSQLWSSEQAKIASGDPDFNGNYVNGTDRYGISGDASHYNEAGIGSAGMDPDLEYHFSFRWKMGPNTDGGGLGFHNSGSETSGKPAIYAFESHHDGKRMLFEGGDDEQVGFTQPEPGAIIDVELVINSTDNYAIVDGVEGLHKGTPQGLMESLDGIFYWHPAKLDNRDGGMVDDIVVSIIDMNPSIPGDANDDGVVDVADLGIVGANFNQIDTIFNQGNFNDDDITDVADLGILGANWTASQATGNASALVPEPTTLSLLMMSVLVAVRRR